jgi:hypothetical protein
MHKTPEITRLIHDNFWIVLSFAFAQPAVTRVLNERVIGSLKYIDKYVYEYAEIRADRALLEMATQLRVLDAEQGFSDTFRQVKQPGYGEVVQADGSRTPLYFKDMTNKIMHGARFEWRLGTDDPTVVIHAKEEERWKTAELNIFALMALMGGLMF